MIKIAYIIDTIASPNAGTEKQLLALLHGLDRSEFEPTLLCLRPSAWLTTQQFPFEVVVLNIGPLLRPSLLTALSRFRVLQSQKRFDIVQTFFVDANLFGTLAARCARVPFVVSSRRNLGYSHTGLHRRLLRLLRPWTTHYLANSKAVLELCLTTERVSRDKITLIYNGLDLPRIAHADHTARRHQREAWAVADDEILVGALANLRPVKDIPALITAAPELKHAFPKTRFVVVGDGPDRLSLKRQITAAGIEACFHLVGEYSDSAPCLAAFDIAVQCSKSEGFSNALIEYMAAGLPIAASEVGGTSEAITHGATGLLYSPDDDTGLETCLRQLLENPAGAKRLGKAARQLAFERYSGTTCISKHQDFYRQLTATRNRR